jgi:hypothetical protein
VVINRKWIIAKLIRALYFKLKDHKKHIPDSQGSPKIIDSQSIRYIKFNWKNKLLVIKRLGCTIVYKTCCRKKKLYTVEDMLFQKGEKQIKKDLNVFSIV